MHCIYKSHYKFSKLYTNAKCIISKVILLRCGVLTLLKKFITELEGGDGPPSDWVPDRILPITQVVAKTSAR